jgi:L-threonylcarbamoyladenylate synthase
VEQARTYAEFAPEARALAAAHWPGPLTLVLPRRQDAPLAPAVTAGLSTVALRAPAHPAMQALLAAVDFPLAAPSANRSGFISPTTPAHVLASLDGRIDLVLDGGATTAGVESTSHYAPGKPVRLGALDAEADEFLIGFGAIAGDCTLSASGDVTEAAARLYACLHQAARAPQPRIAVARVPEQGVGRAINDRLRRAAA